VIPHPLLFYPPDRVFCLFLAPRSEVNLSTASYEVECDVQANTRASIPPRQAVSRGQRDPGVTITHFAPVTIATRPCNSSRSRSGEIFDEALPIVARVGTGGSCLHHSTRPRGFMNSETYSGPGFFESESESCRCPHPNECRT
jgi:hypothetical protein